MQLGRFNEVGLDQFRLYLGVLRQDPKAPPPMHLLTSGEYSDALSEPIDVQMRPFSNRLEFAEWLHDAAEAAGATVPRDDVNFWAWLSLALFDQVCPADGNGKRKIKEDARYLPNFETSRRSYRHALASSYFLYIRFLDDTSVVQPLLCGTFEQLAGEAYRLYVEKRLVDYPAAIGVLRDMYFDAAAQKIRPRAQSKQAGSIRRLSAILGQFSRTFDLNVLSTERLIGMLPKEFDSWKQFQHTIRSQDTRKMFSR